MNKDYFHLITNTSTFFIRKEEKISSAKILRRILRQNKADLRCNAAHCNDNLTKFCLKRRVIFVLIILDTFLNIIF